MRGTTRYSLESCIAAPHGLFPVSQAFTAALGPVPRAVGEDTHGLACAIQILTSMSNQLVNLETAPTSKGKKEKWGTPIQLFLPILQALRDSEVKTIPQLVTPIRDMLDLTEHQVTIYNDKNRKPEVEVKISTAMVHLCGSGLVIRPRRAAVQISSEGLNLLATNPETINYTTLRERTGYKTGSTKTKRGTEVKGSEAVSEAISEAVAVAPALRTRTTSALAGPTGRSSTMETIARTSEALEFALVVELTDMLGRASAAELRRGICSVLEKLGYGQARGEDTLLKGPLGLIRACVQVDTDKQPDVDEMREFVRIIDTHRADIGIYVSAPGFTEEARGYHMASSTQMVLMDCQRLAQLMVQHGIGITEVRSYEVLSLDKSSFSISD